MTDAGAPKGWLASNLANWEERTALHFEAEEYDLTPLRAGQGALFSIEERELPAIKGKRVLHLQCHFGRDSLVLAQRGVQVVGVDFSPTAIARAQELAAELGLQEQAAFHECNLYDAPDVVPGAGTFDLVFVTWGTIGWLPDIEGWAQVVAHFLAPGGQLYFADAHPFPLVFDDGAPPLADGFPGLYAPYMGPALFVDENPEDYTGDNAALAGTDYWWDHQLSEVLNALLTAGLRVEWMHEHDAIPWPIFKSLVKGEDGMFRWPDKPWLPLSYSILAQKP